MTVARVALALAMASFGLVAAAARAADPTSSEPPGIERPALSCDPVYEPEGRRLAATAPNPAGRGCRKSGLYHLIVSHPADCGVDAGGAPLMRFGYLDDSGRFRPAFLGCFRRFDDAHERAAAQAAGGPVDGRRPFWIE
ncbi:MAG: hypothetical protein RIB45_12550 [Marivibrio sp.]|uniref:hypothetical protein n=1 Tax=Marivibrio sp. TaxID=2039719 RepID=UPI0032EBE9D3